MPLQFYVNIVRAEGPPKLLQKLPAGTDSTSTQGLAQRTVLVTRKEDQSGSMLFQFIKARRAFHMLRHSQLGSSNQAAKVLVSNLRFAKQWIVDWSGFVCDSQFSANVSTNAALPCRHVETR